MASVQEALTKATRHMSDMTLSQRLAIGLGVLLVVGSLVWLGQWAATPEMVPLLPQSLEPEELAQIQSGLDAMNEPYRLAGSQILVRAAANRPSIIASLQQSEKLPADTALGFAELVKESNPWISQQENSRRWTVALQSELAGVLRQFNGVKQARVLLNLNARPRGFARTQSESTAGVTIFMRGGEPVSRSLALAAARMVAGAVRGLPVKNVQVIDGENGRVALDWESTESGTASSLHRQRKELESEKALQIKEQCSFDPHVLVSVSVELDHTTSHVQDATPAEGVVVKEESDETETTRGSRAGQPGVQPNVGMAVSSGGTVDHSTTNHRGTTYTPGMTTSTKEIPPGSIKRVTAAISLSYSYLASVYKRNNPEAEAPSETQIEELFARQRDQITRHVAKLVYPSDEEQVSVVWHYDMAEPETVVQAGTLDTSLEYAQKYGPVSGLGLLALISLAMMMRLAKQKDAGESFGMEIGLPEDAIEAAKQAADGLESFQQQQARAGGAGYAGGVGEGGGPGPLPMGHPADGLLEAQEVDEGQVRVTQMIDQVSQMTEDDSEGVASLVENWIEQSR